MTFSIYIMTMACDGAYTLANAPHGFTVPESTNALYEWALVNLMVWIKAWKMSFLLGIRSFEKACWCNSILWAGELYRPALRGSM